MRVEGVGVRDNSFGARRIAAKVDNGQLRTLLAAALPQKDRVYVSESGLYMMSVPQVGGTFSKQVSKVVHYALGLGLVEVTERGRVQTTAAGGQWLADNAVVPPSRVVSTVSIVSPSPQG